MRRPPLVTFALIPLWTIAVVGVVLAEAYWLGPPVVPRGDLAGIERHLVKALADATARERLGSAALVLVQEGRIAAEHGFGIANADTRAPVRPDRTLYQLASVSKAVTAWGVMALVERGAIGLDDPVMRHLSRWRFPGSQEYRDTVTVRHLLSHTGGLDDGLGYGGFGPGARVQTLEESLSLTLDSTVGAPRAVRVAWPPGTAMSYSGGGYTVLQLLIEEVTGRPFADYMRDAVLLPLGMLTASFDLDAIVAAGRAADLATSFDTALVPHPARRDTATAAVGLRATARDVAQFARAYAGRNPVLRPATLRQMLTPQAGTSGSWGLGHTLYVGNDAGGYVAGHDGGTAPAWAATMRVNPATGNAIVVLVSGGGLVSRLGDDWIQWETGKVTAAARRQIVLDRLLPASVAMGLGAIALVLWRLLT